MGLTGLSSTDDLEFPSGKFITWVRHRVFWQDLVVSQN